MGDALEWFADRHAVLLSAWSFALGAVVGSFLNVVIARVPRGQSIVSPPSRCPHCGARIRWYDNVPLVSFIVLRARCRSCGERIPWRYPLVELLMATLAVALVHRFGPTPVGLGYFALVAALVALTFIDLDTWLLPHQITWPLLGLGLLSPLWNPELGFVSSAVGAAAGVLAFGALALIGEKVLQREVMGWGDVWLLGALGAWLGGFALLPVVLLASLQGAAIGALLIAIGRAPGAEERAGAARAVQSGGPAPQDEDWVPPPHAVPFGPFLALAALEQLLLGDRIAALWMAAVGKLVG